MPTSLPCLQVTGMRRVGAANSVLLRRGPGSRSFARIGCGHPVARLVAAAPQPRKVPKLGTQRGSVLYLAPDFDAPLEDMKEYME